MRCTCCGNTFESADDRCPRCGAEQAPAAKTRRLLISFAYAVAAILAVMLLVYVVLLWHEMQLIGL